MLTIGLDATVLNVALPTLATKLDASTSQLQWFGAVYTLVIGALVISMGGLGDRLGRKRVLLAGLAIFGASSAAGAFASSAGRTSAARTRSARRATSADDRRHGRRDPDRAASPCSARC